jgi:hydrogenase expression/formation protein HypE
VKRSDVILLAHGGGGSLTRRLIDEVLLSRLGNDLLAALDDAVCLPDLGDPVVFTTDSYVVTPLFFPGGDIGRLAVCGTVNDLVMQGAEPRYLSLGLILEEGLAFPDLERIVDSIAGAASEAAVRIVTGDTKVVDRGRGNGTFINTAGLGTRRPGVDTHVRNARPGDAVLVTGTLGDHGVAVLSRREGLEFEADIESDVAPLAGLVRSLLEAVPDVRSLRDPTRGGLTAALCDIAASSDVALRVRETAIPVRPAVHGACRLLGLDPLSVANEGKAVVVCPAERAERALEALRAHPLGRDACRIGEVAEAPAGLAVLETEIGGERILELPSGEDLPRIC